MQAECAAVMKAFCDSRNAPADWVQTCPAMKRLKASIYQIESRHFPTPVGIKVFHADKVDPAFPQRLFNDWQRYAAAGRDGFGVPAAYGVLDAHPALVMEWVPARNMGEILLGNLGRRDVRDDALRRAGKWLQWFHAQGGMEMRPYETDIMLAKIDAIVKKIHAADAGLLASRPAFARCLAMLQRATPHFQHIRMPYAPVHGDFTPYNLLLAPGRTVGIDFLARGSMPVTFDICRFLVYMDVHRIFLTRGGVLQRHGCNRHDLDVFMSGYGDSLAGLPARDFLYVHFSEVMRRWAAIILLKAQGKATQRYKRALEMYRVGRMARHIAKGLSRSL